MNHNMDDYESLERRSVNTNDAQRIQRKQEYVKKKKRVRVNVKRAVAAFLLIIALFIGGKIAHNQLEPYFNGSYVNQSYTVGYDSISSNTHRTSDNQGYWYDVDSIARLYDESEMDFDSFVYGAYNGMNMRTIPNMDDLFWQFRMRGITDYTSFTEYVKGCGYTREVDGQIIADFDAWKAAMKKQIRVGNELNDVYTQVGHYEPNGSIDMFLMANGIPDIDIYIYRVYDAAGWNAESKLLCMDELMEDLYNEGYTPYRTFLEYCQSKGLVKEKDGEIVVDTSAYEKKLEQIIERLELVHQYMDEFREFGKDSAPVPTAPEGPGK